MKKKKNLLYVFADQWRKMAMGCDSDPVLTPTMDAFAEQSMVFDQAISTYPLCSPHRAALLTGKYPYSCGMWTNCKIGLDEVLMLKPQEQTIGNVLKEAGYQTAYVGKWHLDGSEKNFYNQPKSGAVNWDAYTPPGERRQGFDYWFSYGAMDNHLAPHYWQEDNQPIRKKEWSVKVETEKAIDYLEQRDKDQPFCLFVSWNPPHPPYDQVPDEFLDKYNQVTDFRPNVPESMKEDTEYLEQVRQYYAAISGVDYYFKQLLEYLDRTGLADETVVVLSADHGDMMGSQGLMGKNIWYEESINIPLMIRDKDLRAGRTDVLFSSVDHMPTLLDLLDVAIPETVQGHSQRRFFDNSFKSEEGGVSSDEPETVFLSMIPGMPDLIAPYRQIGWNNKAFGWRGLRYKKAVYVIDNGCHPDEPQVRYYYDLDKDPYQMSPVVLEQDDPFCRQADPILKEYLVAIKDPFLIER